MLEGGPTTANAFCPALVSESKAPSAQRRGPKSTGSERQGCANTSYAQSQRSRSSSDGATVPQEHTRPRYIDSQLLRRTAGTVKGGIAS
jgi:hypothetical protein